MVLLEWFVSRKKAISDSEEARFYFFGWKDSTEKGLEIVFFCLEEGNDIIFQLLKRNKLFTEPGPIIRGTLFTHNPKFLFYDTRFIFTVFHF